jgi:hypothetical protein
VLRVTDRAIEMERHQLQRDSNKRLELSTNVAAVFFKDLLQVPS